MNKTWDFQEFTENGHNKQKVKGTTGTESCGAFNFLLYFNNFLDYRF